MLRRVVLFPVLLVLAAVLMPLLFISGSAEPTPEPVPDSDKPEASPMLVSLASNAETPLAVSSYGEIFQTTMAEYLPLAVGAEMPVTFEPEALKAQAVAARTYILYEAAHRKASHSEADICTDSGCCLAYCDETKLRANWGAAFNENMEKIRAAVTATDGQVMRYESEVILAAFHSSSAGKTEQGAELWGDLPYLDCVSSPETENDVPNFISTVTVAADAFREAVMALHPDARLDGERSAWIGERELDSSGRVRAVTIGGVAVTGSELRQSFGLRSTFFTLECTGEVFVFTVTGYGHGLGMSQYGANVMAKGGFTYEEILAHYYPETALRQ